jgi:hypothetical protein
LFSDILSSGTPAGAPVQAGVGDDVHLPPPVGGLTTGFAVVVAVVCLLLVVVAALDELAVVVVVVAADDELDVPCVGGAGAAVPLLHAARDAAATPTRTADRRTRRISCYSIVFR